MADTLRRTVSAIEFRRDMVEEEEEEKPQNRLSSLFTATFQKFVSAAC